MIPRTSPPLRDAHSAAPADPPSPETVAAPDGPPFDVDAFLAEPALGGLAGNLEAVGRSLADLSQRMLSLRAAQSELREVITGLGAHQAELEQLRRECQALREERDERELLDPIFLALIAIADRCRQGIAAMRELRRVQGERAPRDALVLALDARLGDLAEIEAVLAAHGVVPFHHPDHRFAPRWQRCVRPVPARRGEFAQQVARRVLPGYRRGDRLLRPECVTVYVFQPPQNPAPKEEAA